MGCGPRPKNPYQAAELHGLDIFAGIAELGPHFKQGDLILDPLPYASNSFDSVSAFDVLEHIPRVAVNFSTRQTVFPFIRLMSEIHRVLKPQGLFYALTPCFPAEEAFLDPTHVNIITRNSHLYFCGPEPYAKLYGFEGQFEAVEARRVYPGYCFSAQKPKYFGLKNWHKRWLKNKASHLVWQLQAVKKQATPSPSAASAVSEKRT